ncbi:protein of unknown function (plasmid) [Cupriavidus neocaledonicus]|uniref:Uncharacterized protein n=1 Tax=Cupriavidus neocaledonicus TaxID=1040979 RepID=A0A375HPV5_9BURK|nr:protein of unknown function [Cupriavidus neocaledonicus]
MLAFGVGACHSGARLRGNFRQLCQTDTGNDRACPGLDWHYAVWTRPADQNPQSGPCLLSLPWLPYAPRMRRAGGFPQTLRRSVLRLRKAAPGALP